MSTFPAAPPPSSPSPAPAVLRLSRPDDVFAAIPYLLGFPPRHSLVVLGLSGSRSRVGVTMRMDLDTAPAEEMATTVVRALRQDRDEEAIMVLYDPTGPVDESDDGRPPGADVFATLRTALASARIRLRDAYRICSGRWWSYLCSDPGCCPPDGTPVVAPDEPGGPSVVAATAVHAGMAILPDRDAVRAGLQPPAPWSRAAAEQALDRVGNTLVARWRAGEQEQIEDELLDLVANLITRFGGRCPALTDDEAAQVAIGLHTLEVRDTVITWTVRSDAAALQRMLVEVVRRIGAPEHVPAATVLAWCAYLRGDGALASVALEVVREADPGYSLALLIDQMVQGGIHPDHLRRATKDSAKELRRRRSTRDAEPEEAAS